MSTQQAQQDLQQRIFTEQANFARGYSPLYSTMLDHVGAWARDPAAAAKRLGEPGVVDVCKALAAFVAGGKWNNELEPTLRLAACLHAFVLDDDERMKLLRPYYTTAGGEADPTDDAFESALAKTIIALGSDLFDEATRWRVRTNETSRGIAWLLPAALVGAEAAYLIELGASAGLNLYAEQRAFDLEWEDGTRVRLGRAADEQFRIAVSGQKLPELPASSLRGPDAVGRMGCDTDPADLDEPAARRILAACVWGDQARRMTRLQEGLEQHERAQKGEIGPVAEVGPITLPDDIAAFLQRALPRQPVAPVICFNTYVTAYLNDVDHRALARRLGAYARSWSLQHQLPWMWVRFEPPRAGEEAAPEPGWCRWRVDLWEGAHHHRIELGWAHPHLVRANLGPGLLELAQLRDPE